MSRTYSKSFVKNPNMADNGPKPKTSSFIGIIPNSSNPKGEKTTGGELSNGHKHTLSSNFGSSNHHSRPSIKEKQALSKSPLPSKSKSKGKTTAQPNKQVKEQNSKKIFLLTTKTKSKSKEQEAFLAMGIRKSPIAENRTPKGSSENQYKIQFNRGKVADNMTPDRCSRSDLTLEECRSTFSVMETQDTLENELLFDAQKKMQRDRISLKPFQTTPNEFVEEEAHRRHTISRDVVRVTFILYENYHLIIFLAF